MSARLGGHKMSPTRVAALSDADHVRVVALASSVAAAGCFLRAEFAEVNELADLALTLGAALLGMLWAAPLTLLAGLRAHASWRLWQPFAGGNLFVLTQGFGWLLFSLLLISSTVAMVNLGTGGPRRAGEFAGCGILGLAAQLLLNGSIGLYQPHAKSDERSVAWSPRTAVSLLCGISGFVFTLQYSLNGAKLWLVFASLAHLLAAAVCHISGWCELPGYRLWQPFGGGSVFYILQSFGWCLFSVGQQGLFALLSINSADVPFGTSPAIGITALSGLGLLLASLSKFDSKADKPVWLPVPYAASAPGVYAGTAFLASGTAFLWMRFRGEYPSELVWLAFGLALSVGPACQYGGLQHCASFRWWQPFKGGLPFICLQIFGWFLYGVAVHVLLFAFLDPSKTLSPAGLVHCICPICVIAQAVIGCSIPYFTEKPSAGHPLSSKMSSEQLREAAGIVLALLVFISYLAVYCEYSTASSLVGLTRAALALITTILCIGVLMVHCHPKFSWRPFEGGPVFVVMQALGWFFFSSALLFHLFILWSVEWALQHSLVMPVAASLGGFALLLLTLSFRAFEPVVSCSPDKKLELEPEEHGLLQQLADDVMDTHPEASLILQRLLEVRSPPASPTLSPRSRTRARRKKKGAAMSWCSGLLLSCSFVALVLFGLSELFSYPPIGKSHTSLGAQAFYLGVLLSWIDVFAIHLWYLKSCYPNQVSPFMPFEGGVNFCVLQAGGWTTFASASLGASCFITMDSIHKITSPASGIIFCIGILFFAAQLVLNISVAFFDPEGTELSQTKRVNMTLLLSLVSLTILSLVDILCLTNIQMTFSMSVAAVFGIFISLPLSYWRKGPGLSKCHNTVLHILACFVWSFSCLLGLVLCMSLRSGSGSDPSTGSVGQPNQDVGHLALKSNFGVMTGSSGMLSQVFLFLALSPHGSWYSQVRADGLLNSVRGIAGCIAFWFGYYVVLPLLRSWLDGPMYWYGVWAKRTGLLSPDAIPFFEGVDLERDIRYGPHWLEKLDIITPKSAQPDATPVVYLHGGGWVCVNTEVLSHSVAPFARAGHPVYAVEFPRAPEDPFPTALISVLKACRWLKQQQGHAKIALLGDSAGGNLATLAAALMSNETLMKQFAEAVDPRVLEWQLPEVERVASIYGCLDQHSWKDTWVGIVLGFCHGCYLPSSNPCTFPSATLGDLTLAQLKNFPETLLICGTMDALIESNRRASVKLTEAGRKCKLLEFPGPHAYHGLPIEWTLGYWKCNTLPTTEALVAFFSKEENPVVRFSSESVPFDWSLPIMFTLTLFLPIALMVIAFIWSCYQIRSIVTVVALVLWHE